MVNERRECVNKSHELSSLSDIGLTAKPQPSPGNPAAGLKRF